MNCPLGCSSCDVDNSGNKVCLEANDGYIILRGAIYQCALPCVTCAVLLSSEGTASICLSCPLGYALSHGTCVNCTDPYAASCSSNNAALSLTCQSGYTTLNSTSKTDAGVCMACADNCVKCDLTGSGNCDLGGCAPSTTQKSDGCLRCFNGCFKCASDPNTCLQCSQYYYLSNTTCLSCTAKCLSCNATTCFNC
jgi:proprotein convertase subtilisin/kexin type 5